MARRASPGVVAARYGERDCNYGLYLVRMRRNRLMARLAVLWLLSLLVLLWRAQQSLGAIVELTKFHQSNVADVSFADDRGNGRNSEHTAEQVRH